MPVFNHLIPFEANFLFILTLAISVYAAGVIAFIRGLSKPVGNPSFSESFPTVSVIVAVRNGAGSLNRLLPKLAYQDYAGEVEFIIVDDESEDHTAEIIRQFARQDHRFLYLSSDTCTNSSLTHKKRALDAGITRAKGEICLFTDVDCQPGPRWIDAMVKTFSPGTDYIIGYVRTKEDGSSASRFQQIDMAILMFCAAGITRLGYAWASMGQNQAWRKELYLKLGGFSQLSHLLQGDDSLFLQMARKKLHVRADFCMDPEGFIQGRTESTWSSLIRQRIRWAGDGNIMWKFNKVFFTYLLSVFTVNLLLLSGLFSSPILPIVAGFILFKLTMDALLFVRGRKVFNEKLTFRRFFTWFIIQLPYIVFMGIMSFFASRFSWRGRKLR